MHTGMLEVCATVAVAHGCGVAVGVLTLAAGLALLAWAACAQEAAGAAPEPQQARLPLQRAPRAPMPPRAATGACTGLLAWTLLLLLVRAASRDPPAAAAAAFPAACAKPHGCGRVAIERPHRAGGAVPLKLLTTVPGAEGAVVAWLRQLPRTDILYRGPETGSAGGGSQRVGEGAGKGGAGADAGGAQLLHARVVTFLWGFAGGQGGPLRGLGRRGRFG